MGPPGERGNDGRPGYAGIPGNIMNFFFLQYVRLLI